MTTDDGLLARVALKVRQGVCGLHGHDALLSFGKTRMSLVCTSCGHESPGWDLRRAVDGAHTTSRAAQPAVAALSTHVARTYAPERRVA
ncbi:MAG TPA: hypothetical protein VIY56_10635 [Vicinamibacterales bacterium]